MEMLPTCLHVFHSFAHSLIYLFPAFSEPGSMLGPEAPVVLSCCLSCQSGNSGLSLGCWMLGFS